jgi:cytochrome c peroxidase
MAMEERRARGARGAAAAACLLGLGAAATGLGCEKLDSLFCHDGYCGWSDTDTERLSALADLPDLATDRSNSYAAVTAAQQLGQQFFADPRFSGTSTGTDAIGRPMPYARAPKGQPINVSCYSCHDLRAGGIDTSTQPGNVSIGTSWTDTNSQSVINAGYQPLMFWNGRADSLWAQATGSIEAAMGSNRARAAWVIASSYRAAYEAVFTAYPMPMTGTITDLTPTLATDAAHAGQCAMNPDCPSTCRVVTNTVTGDTGCWPRFPLDGKPGKQAGCQTGDPTEPFGDAWDCMDPADQAAVTRVAVNFGKAIAAFEMLLISRNSPFDRFVADMRAGEAMESTAISDAAKNGAHLFVGKAGCSDCHNTPLLSDGNYYNIAVPQAGPGVPTIADCPQGGVCDCVTPSNCLPFGAVDGIAKLHKNPYRRDSMWSDDPGDTSRASYVAADPNSFPHGGFRTPSLRNVALTAPYMHTGGFATLEEVVAHYNNGGDPEAEGDIAARIKPLYLTDDEQSQLVAFLKTLTGDPLPAALADPPVLPP